MQCLVCRGGGGGGGGGGYVGALNGKKAVGHPAANCAILYGPTQ